ncbi:MAG TPA: nucleotide disphospho-sugar-binding domain-containing protein, partial [Myxococcaceae bacterium]|nr:nucleotide disphospho-sugar-binding domain-containing protein [Myxococcaceae bacterium]
HFVRFLIPAAPSLGFRLRPDILNTVVDVPASVERMGLPLERLRLPLMTAFHAILLVRAQGHEELRRAQSLFLGGLTSSARDIIRRLERQRPDVMVIDFAFPAAMLAAEKLQIPYATLYHSGLPFRGPGVPPFGSGLPIGTPDGPELRRAEQAEQELRRHMAGKLEEARRALGLERPVLEDFMRTPSSPWLNLVPSHECIEAPRTGLGPSCFFVGPCFATRRGRAAEDFPFERLKEEAFKVYVSLGTVFNNRPEVFRTLIEALDMPGVQAIVSAGASYPHLASRPLPGDVLLFRRVPQLELLPRVDLVIGHGGNNTTNETLAAGKPLLVIPVGGEQRDNSRRVEYLGAGLSLWPEHLSVEGVRQAVSRLREEPRFRERTEELRRRLEETDGTGTSARLIAWLARNRRPVCLPEGGSLTLTREGLERLPGFEAAP